MPIRVIIYDLNDPGQDYPAIHEQIKSYQAHIQITESCWAVSTNKKIPEVRDDLKKVMDKNDNLFVAGLNGWASTALPENVTDWLKRHRK